MPSDQTQSRIADAAIEYMNAFGSEKLNLGDVARMAGVGRATVHRHFGTRDGLVEAVEERLRDQMAVAIVEEAASREHFHEKVGLIAVLLRRAIVDRESPGWFRFFSPMERANLFVGHAGQNIVHFCQTLRPIVVDAQTCGQIRADLDVDFTCEWLARICTTFVLDRAIVDIDDEATVVEFFRMHLVGLR